MDTGDKILRERNLWHDNTWGICICKKCVAKNYDIENTNYLGRILMKIRR